MQELTVFEVAALIPAGIYYGDERTVNVCGAHCPDRDEITQKLRIEGVSVRQNGCHGAIGGCAMNGVLESGSYATVTLPSTEGPVPTEVIIRK